LQARNEAAANVSAAEVHGGLDRDAARSHLDAIESELVTASQQRRGAVDALVAQEQALQSALSQVEREQHTYAGKVAADFEERYRQALQQFLGLWAEGVALSQALRRPVQMPSPVQVRNLGRAGYLCEKSTVVERVLPESIEAKIDPVAEKIGHLLDELSAAITYCKGLADTQSRHRPNLDSNLPFDPAGTFLVRQAFNDPIDGLAYAAGTLINFALIDTRQLQRLAATKRITLESIPSTGRAA
jgi:hypothetical protein